MKFTPLFSAIICLLLLSSCSFSLPNRTHSSPEISDIPPLTPTEIALLTPNTMQIMDKTAETSNIYYTNMDSDADKEALIIFNRYGCTEGDKARLYLMKYDREKQAWSPLDIVVLSGKQGLIDSFKNTPEDITGDGQVDIEILSETIGCGEPWTVYKQLFTLKDGKIFDFTQGQLSSIEGGFDSIQRMGETYQVYTSIGQSTACNPYSITQYTFDGNIFAAQTPSTTKYRYKIVENFATTPREDQFLNGCITTDDANRFFEYIRNDALDQEYPSFVTTNTGF